jgi:iron(III) transport system substrate-binding protein
MRRTVGFVLAALVFCASGAWGQMADWERQLYEAAKKEKEFTVYTAHFPTEAATRICTVFEARYPGVGCKIARMTAQVAFQKFQTEYAANLPIVSVFSSTVGDHCIDMKKRGQLQPYKPQRLGNLVSAVSQHNDPDNMYWATAAGMVILSYNTTLVSEKDAPKKWQDLLDPKWKDKVSIGHPAFSGVVGMWSVAMNKMYGWQYFERLEKNKPHIGRSIQDTVTTLNAKERWVAAGPLGGTLLSRAKGNPVAVIYPEDGAMLNIYPSCIPKNAPSPNAAKLYVDFQFTKESAEVQTTDGAPIIIKGVTPAPGTKAIEQVKVIILSDEEVSKGIPEIKEKFRDTFGI